MWTTKAATNQRQDNHHHDHFLQFLHLGSKYKLKNIAATLFHLALAGGQSVERRNELDHTNRHETDPNQVGHLVLRLLLPRIHGTASRLMRLFHFVNL